MLRSVYTANDLKSILRKSIRQNLDNLNVPQDSTGTAYIHGYHDALVDMLDEFKIPHDYEVFEN